MNLQFSVGEISTSQENQIIISNDTLNFFDYLLFFDSRGLTINSEYKNDAYLEQLITYLHTNNFSYIAISRPKNLTIFATLCNFLSVNTNIQFKSLITNLGFVDCTPKKQKNIDDILMQINHFNNSQNSVIDHEKYQLANGEIEILKTILYSDTYINDIANFLNDKFDKLYFLNTPNISKNANFERKRPNSFFDQLKNTNMLIESIINKIQKPVEIVDIANVGSTYDGVHFDTIGHKNIFTKIKKSVFE